ncbi:MAG TPA: hypothetical protein VMS64_31600 [Candidatus Methylomirabilis sp.]|nr:hypothetical protein [Candidatus Methylomirabilis sp.]
MRETASIPPNPIAGRWASLVRVAGRAARLVAGHGVGSLRARAERVEGPRHLVFVWQFAIDAQPHVIGAVLQRNGLGLILKTHHGVEWMSKFDTSPFAVTGPGQITTLAHYYEEAGVPFHAWTVVKGIDVAREAQMAAHVLEAGARSLFVDLEPFDGFWEGTSTDAVRYGRELRRLAPDGHVVLSVDPRPWVIERLPLKEFVAFSNEIAPQQYWRSFDTASNRERFAHAGFRVPPGGVTPEFLNDISTRTLGGYGLPFNPIGQGAATDLAAWRRFIDHSYGLGARVVSSWRYGVTKKAVFRLLRRTPPRPLTTGGPAAPTS